ncbi:glycine cleavage system aminomethyltransferase GcvT [Haloglomus halophilum]|uniref:glycine cleavage system aminomethyltransferase GcvT n=1 Tax=Haloglomus halophilum TaxID=2962672 RepID=UPI0020CA143C|nr:glycine cleavage system aminomethyltransferase GcvT [Haloglomus halophilum]
MPLRTPPLRDLHADRGAKFTEFGGWDMPVEFGSIRTEHEAVRQSAGLFDVSHMGEVVVSGPDAAALVDRLVTNDVAALGPGEAVYAAITDAEGVMHDDTVVYRLPEDETGRATGEAPAYLFVPNAGHDEWAHERWCDHRDEWGMEATVENVTDDWAMFALQGPDAEAHLRNVAAGDSPDLGRFEMTGDAVAGVDCLVARTGYTGEDGFELLVPWGEAEIVWAALTESGTDEDGDAEGAEDADAAGVQPCGLGARDTLRIEAGFLLAGQDFHPEDEPHNPYEAGIGFVVKLDTEFVGRDALEQVEAEGVDETFVGFRLVERGVPRNGYDITNTDGKVIGTVTSGTMSPTLDEPVGMGYVPVDYADPGTTVRVVVRGQQKKARVQTLPFLDD